MKEFKGDRTPVSPNFRIQFGKEIIDQCPNSYCDWTYVGDALNCYKFYSAGFLPEVWDSQKEQPASILDQTDFFHTMITLVESTKNKAEAEAHKKMMSKSKAN